MAEVNSSSNIKQSSGAKRTLVKLASAVGAALLLSSCGFTLPNQATLKDTIPTINVTGDYHEPFYKMVVNRLRANGVQVNAQYSGYDPAASDTIPTLMLPEPDVIDEVISVNTRAQSIENALKVSVAATLTIPNHRPIVMRNSITRSVINKPGQSLNSDVEKQTVIYETTEHLADQLVLRLGYLGKASDPDAATPQPSDLISADGEYVPEAYSNTQNSAEGLTLIEALQMQDQNDQAAAKTVTLDELNNGNAVFNRTYELPKVKPERLHQATPH